VAIVQPEPQSSDSLVNKHCSELFVADMLIAKLRVALSLCVSLVIRVVGHAALRLPMSHI